MMFARAAFEREVRSLVDAINPNEPGFGERRENQWVASETGTAKIIVLVMKHRGLSHIEQIRNLLNEAVDLCRQRNFLAWHMVMFQLPHVNRASPSPPPYDPPSAGQYGAPLGARLDASMSL
jgi:hypothetical protein